MKKRIRTRKYGETFLTKPRWSTTNLKRVADSPFVYNGEPNSNTYTLSLLGVLNGLLVKFGDIRRLAVVIDKETNEIQDWALVDYRNPRS